MVSRPDRTARARRSAIVAPPDTGDACVPVRFIPVALPHDTQPPHKAPLAPGACRLVLARGYMDGAWGLRACGLGFAAWSLGLGA